MRGVDKNLWEHVTITINRLGCNVTVDHFNQLNEESKNYLACKSRRKPQDDNLEQS